MRIFNNICYVFGIIGGFFLQILGGSDTLLKAILTIMVLDYITGIIKAIYKKQLSSEIGLKGFLKKLMMIMVIALSVVLESIIGVDTPVREIAIMFFIANESISILENIAEFIPIPLKLKNILLQLRDNDILKE